MGVYTRPSIVTNGLILNLDAANIKSYPGSGTTWTDLSGNANNGTLTLGPTFSKDGGGSIVFDGTNSYVNCGTSNSINSTSNLTIDVWVNSNSITTEQMILANAVFLSAGITFEIYQSKPTFAVNPANEWSPTLATLLSNVWYNLVVTLNNKIVTYYINGVLDVTRTYTSTLTLSSSSTSIGNWQNYTTKYPFNGKIPSVKYYNRALTASEVLQNYNALKSRFNLS
jgi:hypothetical protein